MKKLCPSASLLAVLFTVSTFAAHAGTEAAVTSSTFDSNSVLLQISSSDLIESGSSTLSSVTANNAADTSVIATSNAGLNDGGHIDNGPTNYGRSAYYGYNSTANGGAAKANLIVSNQLGGSGEIITFTLNTSINTLGYNISGLNSFAGWQDHASVANQNFTFSYSTVAAPAVFIPVTTVNYNPNNPTADNPGGGGEASLVSLTGLGLVGVGALRLDYTPDPSSAGYGNSATGLWLQEVDAFGTATVPEPGTWAMMGIGAAALLFILRARRLNA